MIPSVHVYPGSLLSFWSSDAAGPFLGLVKGGWNDAAYAIGLHARPGGTLIVRVLGFQACLALFCWSCLRSLLLTERWSIAYVYYKPTRNEQNSQSCIAETPASINVRMYSSLTYGGWHEVGDVAIQQNLKCRKPRGVVFR
jgi:hypothetical protein